MRFFEYANASSSRARQFSHLRMPAPTSGVWLGRINAAAGRRASLEARRRELVCHPLEIRDCFQQPLTTISVFGARGNARTSRTSSAKRTRQLCHLPSWPLSSG